VYVDGYKVGMVNQLKYDYSSVGEKLLVVLDVDKSLKIPKGSKAELKVSLLGTASVVLHLNKYVSTYCPKGDTLEGFSEVGLMDKMGEKMLPSLETMLPRIDTILQTLQKVVTSPAFGEAIQHIENTTANLDKSSQQLSKMMQSDIPVLLSNFKETSSNLKKVSGKFEQMDFENMYASIRTTLDNVKTLTDNLSSTNGTLGLLLNDTKLYDNLSTLTADADSLVTDLKAHPKRYVHFSVFGKKDK